jgi:hypothetical protein
MPSRPHRGGHLTSYVLSLPAVVGRPDMQLNLDGDESVVDPDGRSG